MDPDEEVSSGGRFETFDANLRFAVARDEEGYGVWRLDDLGDGDPIDRFSDDDRGYRAAAVRWNELTANARRDGWLRKLVWIVVVAAVVWVASSAVSALLYLQVGATLFEGTGLFDTLVRWSQLIRVVAQPVTLGGTAVYVVFWLQNRR
ncbi:MAG: hypothetical protein K0R20_482 [Actinomycetia bacterium]|nr:hypothetical protein [Actinomycetes bacterium]